MGHLIHRVTILGTGLIGGSFGLALHKDTTDICVSGWDRPEIVREAQSRAAIDKFFSGDIAPALQEADLIYIALPIAATRRDNPSGLSLRDKAARRASASSKIEAGAFHG